MCCSAQWLPFAIIHVFSLYSVYKRSTGFYISTYDDESFTPPDGATGSLLYHQDPKSGCPDSIMNIIVNRIAQGIAFYNERPPEFSTSCPGVDVSQISLDICEIKVMGELQLISL